MRSILSLTFVSYGLYKPAVFIVIIITLSASETDPDDIKGECLLPLSMPPVASKGRQTKSYSVPVFIITVITQSNSETDQLNMKSCLLPLYIPRWHPEVDKQNRIAYTYALPALCTLVFSQLMPTNKRHSRSCTKRMCLCCTA